MMTEKTKERKLAAILVADVVAYSRLMGENETSTLQALDEHRFAIINPRIGQFHGRIVKLMGDGILAEFPSVMDATECAIAIQRDVITRNELVEKDQRIRFRIGINLGDVLVDGDDIFGDGVNIAARLQEQADPNGICISSTVYNQINGKVDQGFADAGAHEFKNISSAIRIFKCIPGARTESMSVAFRPFIDLPAEEKPLAKGGCMCGKIRYEITSKSLGSMLCHCRMCQRFSGAPMLEGTTFPKSALRITKGNPKVYRSSLIAERGFCGDCGSPVFYRGTVKYWTKWIVITTGSLDEPWLFPPTYHLGMESKLPWLDIIDDLPRTECKDSPSLIEAYNSVGQEVP